MNSRTHRPASGQSSLMALQPIDSAPFYRPAPSLLVWGSLIGIWMASLLPWRLWAPVPDLLMLVLAFWCLHEPNRVGLFTAFVLGVLMDVHDTGLLGLHALCYVLVAYGILRLNRRLQHFNPWVQMLHVLPIFIVALMASHLLGAWMNGEWVGWDWLWSGVITAVLWPLADVLLLLYQRRLDGSDVGSV
ncbi:MAG TPA: rod shape-determining protein MreD [Castellaniella sp.]|uniref:rod shape-determining protein MreD n=1 Tax=Castellaniella sp. TaxID=1955812 RepID=UPI002EE6C778